MELQVSKIAIKEWAKDDRPREKMLYKGTASLSDAEIIAILIGSGSASESAVELSKRILASVGNDLNKMSKLSVKDLMKFKGIGEAKALTIAAAMELGRRRRENGQSGRTKISSSGDAYALFAPGMEDIPHEEFWVLLLNRANTVIQKALISRGGITGTVADTRIIYKMAIDNLASAVILCHNHPSGNLLPSESDIQLTRKLSEVGRVMDIPVLDHIIVSDQGYYSFADEGML